MGYFKVIFLLTSGFLVLHILDMNRLHGYTLHKDTIYHYKAKVKDIIYYFEKNYIPILKLKGNVEIDECLRGI
jgi:hypothetical protein